MTIVHETVELVPAGVPALVPEVVWFVVPVNVSAGTVPAEPAKVGTPPGHEIAPWLNAPLALVGTPTGHEIAPSENEPPELVPAGVPALVPLVVWFAVPVKTCAAAVRELTVSAGTVVLEPVNVCAAAVSELTVSAGTVVVLPVNVCAEAMRVETPEAPTSPFAVEVTSTL